MRPWHEMARLLGLEEGSQTPEPARCNSLQLVSLGRARMAVGGSTEEAIAGMEFLCREENYKPACLMAAVRELEISEQGQPQAWTGRRLITSGKVGEDGSILFRFHRSGHNG